MSRLSRPIGIAAVALVAMALAVVDAAQGAWAAWTLIALLAALVAGVLLRVRSPDGAPGPSGPGLAPLFREALILGLVGFGGGMAVLSQIESRFVARRRWVAEDVFLEAAALGQSLPGAIAVNALGFIGLRLGGVSAALLLVTGFILPSFLLLLGFALLYSGFRHLPGVEALFRYLAPAAAGLVAATAFNLVGRGALTGGVGGSGWRGLLARGWPPAIALGAFVAVGFLGFGVVETVLLAGLVGIARHPASILFGAAGSPEAHWGLLSKRIWNALHQEITKSRRPWWRGRDGRDDLLGAAPLSLVAPLAALFAHSKLLVSLAGIFLRAGALTFGGGFVMIPLLEAELVRTRHWLSPSAFADAMALGQVTPGPVVITATFVGYSIAGLAGAILSTVAVFLPAFLMMWVVGSQIERFRRTAAVQGFLQGIQPAVVGLMLAAAVAIARNGVGDWRGAAVSVAALAAVWLVRVNPMWVMLAASALGLAELALRTWLA